MSWTAREEDGNLQGLAAIYGAIVGPGLENDENLFNLNEHTQVKYFGLPQAYAGLGIGFKLFNFSPLGKAFC